MGRGSVLMETLRSQNGSDVSYVAESVKGFQEETTSHAKYWPREHGPFGELVQVKPFREQVGKSKSWAGGGGMAEDKCHWAR